MKNWKGAQTRGWDVFNLFWGLSSSSSSSSLFMSILWIEEFSDFLPRLEDCVAPLPLPLGAALFRAGRLDSLSYANIRCSRLLNNWEWQGYFMTNYSSMHTKLSGSRNQTIAEPKILIYFIFEGTCINPYRAVINLFHCISFGIVTWSHIIPIISTTLDGSCCRPASSQWNHVGYIFTVKALSRENQNDFILTLKWQK